MGDKNESEGEKNQILYANAFSDATGQISDATARKL